MERVNQTKEPVISETHGLGPASPGGQSMDEDARTIPQTLNVDLLVSMPGAPQTPQNPNVADSSLFSTADLVKLLEIVLAEVRANQNFTFSVLGFSIVAGSILQRMHTVSGIHGDISRALWLGGIGFCATAAIWSALSRRYLTPLGTFLNAVGPGETELVLSDLRTALNRAKKAAEKAYGPRFFVSVGVALILFAVAVEIFECTTR